MENKEKHPKMPISQRAKQFLPFVAQPGLYEALEAEARRHEVAYRKNEPKAGSQRNEPEVSYISNEPEVSYQKDEYEILQEE